MQRRNVGIGRALAFGDDAAQIVGAAARAQARQRVEARRIRHIGGDVGDGGQFAGAVAEIGRIAEQQQAEKNPENGVAEAFETVPPDADEGGEGEQDRQAGKRQSGAECGERRHDLQKP